MWVAKDRKGPSDPQAVRGAGDRPKKTAGGREVPLEEWTREDLYLRAKQLEIKGRSSMSKRELIRAIEQS